jgi:hypothetical protein
MVSLHHIYFVSIQVSGTAPLMIKTSIKLNINILHYNYYNFINF